VAFSKLFHGGSHRGEIIITFLALLELLRLRQVTMQQNEAFLEIMILPVAENASEPALPAPVIGGAEHVSN
jgi:segregation and condensation protein A